MKPVAVIAILLAAGVAAAAVLLGPAKRPDTPRVYCGPDGRVTRTRPIQSHRSYCFRSYTDLDHVQANRPFEFTFDLLTDEGNVLRDFVTVHEKKLHLILVGNDLTNFQHVHPKFDSASGRWTLAGLVVPVDGEYRVFADFTPAGGMALQVTSSADFKVGGAKRSPSDPLGAPDTLIRSDGYEVRLATPESLRVGEEVRLVFSVSREGKAITNLEPYLGALGHAVVLKERDLTFLHAHALAVDTRKEAGAIAFAVHFPEPGRYKSFLQFQHVGRVITAAFVLPPVVEALSEGRTVPPKAASGHGAGH